MIKCTHCQSDLPVTAKFCPYCGTPVIQEEKHPLSSISNDTTLRPANKVESSNVSAKKSRTALILWSMLFAVAGFVLILVVAPELQGRYGNWLIGYVDYQTAESWAAMIGGGVSLLLSGIFLLRALVD